MKALFLNEKHELFLKRVTNPTIQDNEVLIEVKACGICKTDVDMYKNKIGAGRVMLPIIPGHEFSGIVVGVGASVEGINRGERVSVNPVVSCGKCKYCLRGMRQFCKNRIVYGTNKNGGMSELCAVNHKQVYPFDSRLSYEDASLAEPLGCCLHAITKVSRGINNVEQVIIIGGGTLGMLLLQVLIYKGVKKIVVVEPKEAKRGKAVILGASASVPPDKDEIKETLRCFDMEWIDVVFDCVGSSDTINLACEVVGRCGEVILIGIPDASETNKINVFDVFRKEVLFTGSCLNSDLHSTALSFLTSGTINTKLIIEKSIPLSDVVSVFNEYDLYNGKVFVSF